MKWLVVGTLVFLSAGAVAGALLLTRGGGSGWDGSTLHATWVDPRGTGVLERGAGEPLAAPHEYELAPDPPL